MKNYKILIKTTNFQKVKDIVTAVRDYGLESNINEESVTPHVIWY